MQSSQGGVTALLLDCVFNGHESVAHFLHNIDRALYRRLPNLYAVSIADDSERYRNVVAGLFIKTSFTHHDQGFADALDRIVQSTPELSRFVTGVLLSARLAVADGEPLTENEMLSVLMKQQLKHSGGAARSSAGPTATTSCRFGP